MQEYGYISNVGFLSAKIKISFLVVFLLATCLNAAVVVEMRDEQAPNTNLVLGQSSKKLYGRFLGKNITVHQYATVRYVAFKPETATEIAGRGR